MDQNKKLFPQRLWELVHDEKYDFCLRWSPDGQKIYLNRNEFETHYLRTPNNQFHTKKAISFVRQMNMYGFRKVDDCYYENDNFKRNCHHLLKNMVRRHSNKPSSSHPNTSTHSEASNLTLGRGTVNHDQSFHGANIDVVSPSMHDSATPPSGLPGDSTSHISDGSCSPQSIFQDQQPPQNQPLASIQSFYRQFTGLNAAATANNLSAPLNHQVLSHLNNDEPSFEQMTQNNSVPKISVTNVLPPLNSTLYQRLAALNFGVPHNTLFPEHAGMQARQLSQLDEQAFQKIYSLSEQRQNRSVLGFNTTNNLAQQMSTGLQQTSMGTSTSFADQQQTLAARQALFQQTLVGSLLRLRQPQPFISALSDSLLTTFGQQNMSLLSNQTSIEASLANEALGSARMSTSLESDQQAEAPLELVVDSPRSSSSSNQNLIRQFSSSNLSNYSRSNEYLFSSVPRTDNLDAGRWGSPNQRVDDFVDDDGSFCSNDEEADNANSSRT